MKNWLNQDLAIGDYVVDNVYRGNSMYVGKISHMRTGKDGIDKIRMVNKFYTIDNKTFQMRAWDHQLSAWGSDNIESGGWVHAYKVTKIDKSVFDNIVAT